MAAGLVLVLSGCISGYVAQDRVVGPPGPAEGWSYPKGWQDKDYWPGRFGYDWPDKWFWAHGLAMFDEPVLTSRKMSDGEWTMRIQLRPPVNLPAVFRIERSSNGAKLIQKKARHKPALQAVSAGSAEGLLGKGSAAASRFIVREVRISAEEADRLLALSPVNSLCSGSSEYFVIIDATSWFGEYGDERRFCAGKAANARSEHLWHPMMAELLPRLGYSENQVSRFLRFH